MAKKSNVFTRLFARRGLVLVLVAALLLEAIGLIQYYYSKKGLTEEAEARAKSELTASQFRMNNIFLMVENNVRGISWAIADNLYNPDRIPELITMMMQNNSVIANGFIAYEANYYPDRGFWYEPVVSRWPEGLILHQVGSADHDYFHTDWYSVPLETGQPFWSEPYFDKDGVRELVVTYSVPIYEDEDSTTPVAVLGVDVELDWLSEVVSDVRPYPNSYSTIVSREGQLIAAPADTVAVANPLRYEATIERTGWRMAVVIPEDAVYGKIKRINTIVFFLQIIGLLLIGMIIQWTARGQSKLEKVKEVHDRMENELEIARGIQMSMIPNSFPPFPERHDLDMAATIVPAKEVGGDLYDFYIRDGKLFFCVGDVSGKGVPASLVMAVTRTTFRNLSVSEDSPGRIVTAMNDNLSAMNESNMFVTFFCGVLNLADGHLRYCNAGHNPPMVLTDAIRPLPVVPNLPLGIMGGMEYQEQEAALQFDDALFLYTDGLTEAENAAHEQFGEERMKAALRGRKSSDKHLEMVESQVEAFVGDAPQSDDLTMLFIHYVPSSRRLVLHNKVDQISLLPAFVEEAASGTGLEPDKLNLALEEAVANVILYAYPEGTDGEIILDLAPVKGALTFTITDSGKPFDPTAKEDVDVNAGVEERPVGGLGIHLVRQIMDEVRYERRAGKNVLILTKKY